MTKKILTPKEAKRKTRAEFALFVTRVRNYSKYLNLDKNSLVTIRALLGVRYRTQIPQWSDIRARYYASREVASIFAWHYNDAPVGRSYYLLSFADDCGTTSDRVPHLAIQQLTKKVRRAISKMGLHAFVMLEVHPLMNYPGGGAGRSMLLGAHAIAWTDMPFDHAAHARALCASPTWRCTLGARPVDIRPIEPDTIENVAYYLMKQSPSVKNLMPSKKPGGGHTMKDNIAGYRDEFAFRLFEGQSQVELASMMFGVGDGRLIRQAVRERVTRWHRTRPEPVRVKDTLDVWAFWHQLRQGRGSKRFLPYRFDGGAIKPRVNLSPPRISAATPSRDAVAVEADNPVAADTSTDTNFLGEAITAMISQQLAAQRKPKTKKVKPSRRSSRRNKRPERKLLGPRRD